MTQNKVRLALASACLLAFTATACSSDDKTSDVTAAPSADSGAPAAAGLTISGNTFSVAAVTAGTEFTIVNNDGVGHTVTDDASPASFDVAVPGGGSETLTIATAGTYNIHCKIHASMHGTITVA